MAPTLFSGEPVSITEQERRRLLALAHEAIEYGVRHQRKLAPDLSQYPAHLTENGAVFVTLRKEGVLRGCIGSIAAYQPLVVDVSDKAYCAAFQDPRFPPVRAEELPDLTLQISRLTPLAPIEFRGEDDLLSRIRPGIDGLVIDAHGRKGTFLPSMWEQLPATIDFWHHLKLKAGLPVSFWSDEMQVYRFETECFADPSYFAECMG